MAVDIGTWVWGVWGADHHPSHVRSLSRAPQEDVPFQSFGLYIDESWRDTHGACQERSSLGLYWQTSLSPFSCTFFFAFVANIVIFFHSFSCVGMNMCTTCIRKHLTTTMDNIEFDMSNIEIMQKSGYYHDLYHDLLHRYPTFSQKT